jgi:hypothetical protein
MGCGGWKSGCSCSAARAGTADATNKDTKIKDTTVKDTTSKGAAIEQAVAIHNRERTFIGLSFQFFGNAG